MSFRILSDWIDARLLAMRRHADPQVDARVARLAGGVVARIPGADLRAYLAQRIPRFPRHVVGAILRDETLAERLQLGRALHRELSGVVFPASQYWEVACTAVHGSPVQLASEDGRIFDVRVANRLGPYGPWPHLAFVHGDKVVYDTDWRIEMSCGDEQTIREAVDRQRERLELSEDEEDELIARLTAAPSSGRVSITDGMELELPLNFYETVRARIETTRAFTARDLVPERLEGLPRRLGFIHGPETAEQAAAALLRRVGAVEALGRWSGLPVPLPQPLLSALSAAADPSTLVAPLLETTRSPVSLLHQARLASYLDEQTRRKVFDEILGHALDAYDRGSFELHLTLLRWFANDFSRNPSFADWPLRVRLAVIWQHTHEVMRVLIDARVPRDFVELVFSPRPEHDEEALLAPAEQLRDVSHPLNVTALRLLLHGTAIAKGETGLDLPEAVTDGLLNAFTGDDTAVHPWSFELYGAAGCTNSLDSFLASDVAEALRILPGDDAARPPLHMCALTQRLETFIVAPSLDEATYIANSIGWRIDDEPLVDTALRALEATAVAQLRTPEVGPWHFLIVALARFAAFAGESPRQRARTAITTTMSNIEDFGPADFAASQSAYVWLARSADPQMTLATYFADIRTFAGRDSRCDRVLRRITQFAKARLPARLVPKELSELELLLRMTS